MRVDRVEIAQLLKEANALATDAPDDVASQTMISLRDVLSTGIPENGAAELRAYLSIARRFGYAADVWNAALLLEAHTPLDPAARAARAEAWLILFPDTARARPGLLSELLDGKAGCVSDAARSEILAGWCRMHTASAGTELDLARLAGNLRGADLVASSWWPVETWAVKAPAFAASYFDAARTVAERVNQLPTGLRSDLATIWARALLMAPAMVAGLEVGPEVVTVLEVPGQEATEEEVQLPPLGQEELYGVGRRISDGKKRIWVVGALSAKWEQLLGLAKQYGLHPSVFQHAGYDDVVTTSMVDRVNTAKDVGILIGPVPHSARDVGDYSSLVQQLRHTFGIPVVEMRAQSTSNELRVTKTSFRNALLQLLTRHAADD